MSGEVSPQTAAIRSGLVRSHILETMHVVLSHCYLLPLGVRVKGFRYPATPGDADDPAEPSVAVSRVQVHPDAVSESLAALLGALLATGIRAPSSSHAAFHAECVERRLSCEPWPS